MYRGKALWAIVIVFTALWLTLTENPQNSWQTGTLSRLNEQETQIARRLDQVGRSCIERAEYGRAILFFTALIKKYPRYENADSAMLLMGICWGSLGYPDQMANTFSEFLSLYPHSKYADHVRQYYNRLRETLSYRIGGGMRLA